MAARPPNIQEINDQTAAVMDDFEEYLGTLITRWELRRICMNLARNLSPFTLASVLQMNTEGVFRPETIAADITPPWVRDLQEALELLEAGIAGDQVKERIRRALGKEERP